MTNRHLEDEFLAANKITRITPREIADIEQRTREQAATQDWFNERKLRVTASRVSRLFENGDRNELVRSILFPEMIDVPATRHGRDGEPIAIREFEQRYGVRVQRCGLVVHRDKPYLAASPDGLLPDAVVEVKCPYTARDLPIRQANLPYLNADFTLKTNCRYYYQIQTQLACTGLNKCVLVIKTNVDMLVVDVYRDEAVIQEIYRKVNSFFEEYLRKAILDVYFYKRGLQSQ